MQVLTPSVALHSPICVRAMRLHLSLIHLTFW